ncbi:sugar-binding domain-containing protein [Flavivirga algicola]|uniref:Glycoside hydrolase family 2 protein n=1 Tax=Flavivirga algicola TaxID=2729136 RepID=A0ABX1RWH6_9FLAO|nr:sugar-binding domain-containing protein [Flavivirga algicola]NMH87930.1 glycoside hydrolase family 2 protein [Flavivirga algicola]
MRIVGFFLSLLILISCHKPVDSVREIEDFNYDWKFHLIDDDSASEPSFDDASWKKINVPHDWSIEAGYQKEKGAASTGFVAGGIGWYRKAFALSQADEAKVIRITFDGVYNNSSVWINGHLLGKRPYGYSTFSYNLSEHLKFDGSNNVIAVKVDRTAYVDSRWYTGSGIYRKVQLIKTSPLHVKQWGVQITTPKVSSNVAEVHVITKVENSNDEPIENGSVKYSILGVNGNLVAEKVIAMDLKTSNKAILSVETPELWGVNTPNLYTLNTQLFIGDKLIDNVSEVFGIRIFNFDANNGFSLNGENFKIKGVNLHHDAGALGAAVPKAIWEYRIDQLKSIGVNAVRMAHNPHAVELMEVCDEKGLLVMAEAFDEWSNPKGKSLIYLGDNAAPKESAKAYPEMFNEWAERDLKDLILRDFNHPSVIMWSIGNEIEWTFPHYSKTFNDVNIESRADGYNFAPNYDPKIIKEAFDKNIEGIDPLATTAKQLVDWVKEIDTSRPTVCGSVLPSIAMASGYGKAVDILGFNYRLADYDAAHKQYPDLKILGSENWGAYKEWKACTDRDFVAGIFAWTGFAYLGEAGPWPRKGLEISFFDYAGFKTPRGHFFECLWKEDPKVYMVTIPVSESEFSFNEDDGWKFDIQLTPPPVWKNLRLWEWYKVNSKWHYTEDESIVVQAYTNCEEAELFLNGTSLGRQKRSDFEDDNIIKWLVPYKDGELKVIGYNNGEQTDEYILNTQGELSKIAMSSNKQTVKANDYDVAVVTVELLDNNGELITDAEEDITFSMEGDAKNLGVDNGWEKNVSLHKSNTVTTRLGKAVIFVQSTKKKGDVIIKASNSKGLSGSMVLKIN